MAGIRAEQMVFLDESLFNKTTGWRLTAWAPIGQAGRYTGDRNRGHSWSLLAAYTTGGYLPCYTIKEGYFNTDSFYRWLVDELLLLFGKLPSSNWTRRSGWEGGEGFFVGCETGAVVLGLRGILAAIEVYPASNFRSQLIVVVMDNGMLMFTYKFGGGDFRDRGVPRICMINAQDNTVRSRLP